MALDMNMFASRTDKYNVIKSRKKILIIIIYRLDYC